MLIPVEFYAIKVKSNDTFYAGDGEFTNYADHIKLYDRYEDATDTIYSNFDNPKELIVVSGIGVLKVDERMLR